MIDQDWPKIPPEKILLATDLSGRGDRALDRAAQLARQWDAKLLVLHALEPTPEDMIRPPYEEAPSWRRPPDPAAAIERRIRADLRDEVADLEIRVQEGNPAQAIMDVASSEGCDLVILGMARDEMFGRVLLGSTVEHMVRKSPVSVLVVKTRPRGPYAHILVGTDFTEESRHGLKAAATLFPESAFTLMHAFDMPYKNLRLDTKLADDFGAMEKATIEAFIDEAKLPENVRAKVRTMIEHGAPEIMLRDYAIEQGADLTVIGAYGRGLLFHVLIGGAAKRIVDSIPSDILVIRARDEG